MAMPLRQTIAHRHVPARTEAQADEKFPLLVELEPLFACNLECAGCGKIQHPADVLKQRMPVDQAVGRGPGVRRADGVDRRRRAADAPADRRDRAELVKRKKFVFLCTNAMLLRKKIDKFTPSPYFALAVHIDGMRERHDESVEREGVVRRGRRGDQGGQAARLPGHHQHDLLHTDTPQT